jgi:hypothetical protein
MKSNGHFIREVANSDEKYSEDILTEEVPSYWRKHKRKMK